MDDLKKKADDKDAEPKPSVTTETTEKTQKTEIREGTGSSEGQAGQPEGAE